MKNENAKMISKKIFFFRVSNLYPVLVHFLEGHPFGSHPQKKKKWKGRFFWDDIFAENNWKLFEIKFEIKILGKKSSLN